MNPDKLRLMLIDIFGEEYETRGGQFRVNCISPDCSDKTGNLEINLKRGLFHCWRCDYSGSIRKLFKDVLGRDIDLEEEYVSADALRKFQLDFQPEIRQQKKFMGLPEEFCPLWDQNRKLSMAGEKALQYALSRMSWDDIVKYKVGYCGFGKYKWRVIIPFFEGGSVVYFLGRAMFKSIVPPYLNSDSPKSDLIFNYERALEVGSGAIVEGVFDAIKIGDEPPVVGLAILGTAVQDEQLFKLNQIKNLTVMLDNDAKIKTYKIATLLRKLIHRPKLVILPHGDPDDFTRSELYQMLSSAKHQSFLDELQFRMG